MRMGVAKDVRSFDFHGVRYCYLTWGPPGGAASSVPAVLLHGFAQSASSWETVAPLLAENRTVYALDLVGHGGSSVPYSPMPYTLRAQGEALLAFLKEVAHAGAAADGGARTKTARRRMRPAVVGYSMGGRVALAALQADPSAFAAAAGTLVLESAGLGPDAPRAREEAAARDAEQARRLRSQGLAAFMDAWERQPLFASQRALPASARARVRAGRLANDAEALARTFEHAGQHAMPPREEVLRLLAGLQEAGVPVHYLAGAEDAKYRAFAEAIPPAAATPHVVEAAGHNIHLEQPNAFAALVQQLAAPRRRNAPQA